MIRLLIATAPSILTCLSKVLFSFSFPSSSSMLYPRSLPRISQIPLTSPTRRVRKGEKRRRGEEKLFMLSLYLHRQTNICCHAFQSRPISNTPYPQNVAQYVLFLKKVSFFLRHFLGERKVGAPRPLRFSPPRF